MKATIGEMLEGQEINITTGSTDNREERLQLKKREGITNKGCPGCKLLKARLTAMEGVLQADRVAAAALVHLAAQLSTPEKISINWLVEAFKVGRDVILAEDGKAAE